MNINKSIYNLLKGLPIFSVMCSYFFISSNCTMHFIYSVVLVNHILLSLINIRDFEEEAKGQVIGNENSVVSSFIIGKCLFQGRISGSWLPQSVSNQGVETAGKIPNPHTWTSVGSYASVLILFQNRDLHLKGDWYEGLKEKMYILKCKKMEYPTQALKRQIN
jgi:hypothetical protein